MIGGQHHRNEGSVSPEYPIVENSEEDLTVIDSKDNNSQRENYINILVSQLSHYEILCIFYHGISEYGKTSFKSLIERNGLLRNISHIDLIEDDYEKKYEASAYYKNILFMKE